MQSHIKSLSEDSKLSFESVKRQEVTKCDKRLEIEWQGGECNGEAIEERLSQRQALPYHPSIQPGDRYTTKRRINTKCLTEFPMHALLAATPNENYKWPPQAEYPAKKSLHHSCILYINYQV